MELRQLRYFVAVAEERHFGRAASRLHIATPSLSQQIRVLERDLRSVLFERTHREVRLTAAGEALLDRARVLVATAERARDEVRLAEQGGSQELLLRLATGAQYVLGSLLDQLDDRPGSPRVSTAVGFDSDVLRAVRHGHADAGVVWAGPGDGSLAQAPLRRVDLDIAVPPGHRLADADAVTVADLAAETLVLLPRALSPVAWDWLVHRLRPGCSDDEDLAPSLLQIPPISAGVETLLEAVATGAGVTPSVETAVQRCPGVVLRPLLPALAMPLVLVWREPATPAVRRLATLLGRAPSGGAARRQPARR